MLAYLVYLAYPWIDKKNPNKIDSSHDANANCDNLFQVPDPLLNIFIA
jgi:hypothetical protein